MVRVCTCSRKKRTLKHKSNKSGDQSFFYVQLSCSVPAASWATQAQSLISMWSLTWTRHHAVNMKGYANTQALSLSLSHTRTHSQCTCSFMSVCHVRSILSKKRARNTKTNKIRTPQLPPTPHSFSALRIQFISIMEKRKSASTRIVCGTSTNSSPLLFFFFFAEGANQTACLTKFMQVPLLKRKRKKKGHVWIMNLCWEWTSVSVSLSIFFFFF